MKINIHLSLGIRVSIGCVGIGEHGEEVADSVCGENGGLGKLCSNGILFKF